MLRSQLKNQGGYPGTSFYRSDPLARFLLDRCRLTPVSFALLSAIIMTGLYILSAWASNTLVLRGEPKGLLEDWFPWLWVCFFNPVILGYYLWAAKAIGKLSRNLEKANVVEIYEKNIDMALSAYQQPWRKVFALGIAIICSLLFFLSRSDFDNWTGSGTLPKLAATTVTLPTIYMGSMLVLNLITNIWVIQEFLSNKELQVNPLHPDQCGGLSSLSEYSLKTAYLAAVFGGMIGLSEYQVITQGLAQRYWILHLGLLLYLVVSLLCFFAPLLTAHTGMKEAKEKLLMTIAQQFHDDYKRTQSNLNADAQTLKNEIAKIRELRSFYALTDKFPVWPFDVQTLRKYSVSAATPLLPPLIGLLQKALPILLKHSGIKLG